MVNEHEVCSMLSYYRLLQISVIICSSPWKEDTDFSILLFLSNFDNKRTAMVWPKCTLVLDITEIWFIKTWLMNEKYAIPGMGNFFFAAQLTAVEAVAWLNQSYKWLGFRGIIKCISGFLVFVFFFSVSTCLEAQPK